MAWIESRLCEVPVEPVEPPHPVCCQEHRLPGPGVNSLAVPPNPSRDRRRDHQPSPASVIRIGVLAGEPIRLAGLSTVFEEPPEPGRPQLQPVVGTVTELLADPDLLYMVIDVNSSDEGLRTLENVKRRRPGIRQIVIGPENDDELVLEAITAGARAYLDSSADPHTVRMAIDIVVSGSIWAPRRLLSRLIDRLLGVPGEGGAAAGALQLTARERQVLDLILLARSNREIAAELGIEERTVKAHVGRLMRKTGAENRIELSIRALNRRAAQEMLDPEEKSQP
jgi:DNA-binding NarL/FixJ family response regulator